MPFLRLIMGGALLTLGRRLFWLFVAILGFVVGLQIGADLFPSAPAWLIVASAIIGGALGALVAIFLQKLGIAAAGLLAGAYLAFTVVRLAGLELRSVQWILYLLGGILGAVLMSVLFEWALIGLSSLIGSLLIVQSLELGSPWGGMLFFALVVLGVALQGRLLGRKREQTVEEP